MAITIYSILSFYAFPRLNRLCSQVKHSRVSEFAIPTTMSAFPARGNWSTLEKLTTFGKTLANSFHINVSSLKRYRSTIFGVKITSSKNCDTEPLQDSKLFNNEALSRVLKIWRNFAATGLEVVWPRSYVPSHVLPLKPIEHVHSYPVPTS